MPEEPEAPAVRRIPLVPLRDDVIFPKLIVPLSVGRRTSIAAITAAMDRDKQVLLVAQRDPQIDDTREADLYGVGTIAEINGMRQTPAGVQMLVGGAQRVRIVRFVQFTPFIEVEVEPVLDDVGAGLELETARPDRDRQAGGGPADLQAERLQSAYQHQTVHGAVVDDECLPDCAH